jgi:hypothetical protein
LVIKNVKNTLETLLKNTKPTTNNKKNLTYTQKKLNQKNNFLLLNITIKPKTVILLKNYKKPNNKQNQTFLPEFRKPKSLK